MTAVPWLPPVVPAPSSGAHRSSLCPRPLFRIVRRTAAAHAVPIQPQAKQAHIGFPQTETLEFKRVIFLPVNAEDGGGGGLEARFLHHALGVGTEIGVLSEGVGKVPDGKL